MTPLQEIMERERRRILVLNGITIVLGVVLSVVAWSGQLGRIKRETAAFLMGGVGLLALAHLLVLQGKYQLGRVLMLLGGVGTLPVGLLSVYASLRARRLAMRSLSSVDESLVCRECGYSLRGIEPIRCPECGCVVGFNKTFEQLGVSASELRDASAKMQRSSASGRAQP